MRLYFLNILFQADEARFERLIQRVRDLEPDVIAFVEADGWARGRAERFARELKKDSYVAESPSGLDLAVFAPYGWMSEKAPVGSGLFFHGACRVTVRPRTGGPFRLYTTHLSPKGEDRRLKEMDALLADAASGPPGEPVLIVGDLNSVRGEDRIAGRPIAGIVPDENSPYWLHDKLPPRVIDRVLKDGWHDLYRELEPQADGFTFPSTAPAARYDFALANAAMRPRVRGVQLLGSQADVQVSDHLGLMVRVE